jgi:hypothetical protein
MNQWQVVAEPRLQLLISSPRKFPRNSSVHS